eukprot:EG_transcript_32904
MFWLRLEPAKERWLRVVRTLPPNILSYHHLPPCRKASQTSLESATAEPSPPKNLLALLVENFQPEHSVHPVAAPGDRGRGGSKLRAAWGKTGSALRLVGLL